MSEELLKALMRLFALASNDDDLTQESRDIVELFLESELGRELVPQYLSQYDGFVKHYQRTPGSNQDSLDPDNVQLVCSDINRNLVQKQKFVVLIRLLEYIFADGNISDHELEFLRILSNVFNISEEEFSSALQFARSTATAIEDADDLLLLADTPSESHTRTKHMPAPNLDGALLVVHFSSVKMFVIRYFGTSTLYLNGQILQPGRMYILTNGSAIRSKKIQPIYYSDILSNVLRYDAEDELVFQVSGIEYEFPNGKKGLHPLSFSEQSGRLIGIMGGSGAGKSTLLSVLNGTYIPSKGSVTINGVDVHRQQKKIEGVIGHVSQDDLLMEDLTVYQNLYYNAKLCFAQLPEEEITAKVNELLESLGLSETKHLKVGNPVEKVISGGQRKRLNIALELIREPAVLFVDEPTSGLSSRDSENIMDLLKQLALKGKLVFVVIHQPSSDIFKMFDKMCILDLGGYCIYYGDPVESILYFKRQTHQVNSAESECLSCGNVNPEQLFNIVEARVLDEYGNRTKQRKVSPQRWNEAFLDSHMGQEKLPAGSEPPKSKLKTPGYLKQFWIFVQRDVLSKLANRPYLLINLLEAPVLAIILSYFIKFSAHGSADGQEYTLLDNENLPAYIFMAVVVALFMGLTVSAEEIIRDQKIRKRESFLNLSKGSYLWSKVLILFALSALQTFSFTLIGNSVMEIHGLTWTYWAVLFSTAAFANMLGLNISASFNSAVTIYILIPFLIIPQLIFSGVIVKFDKLNPNVSSHSHVPFIGEVMASRWAFEALAVAQFRDNRLERTLFPVDQRLGTINYRKIYWLPEIDSRLTFVNNYGDDPERQEEVSEHIALLRNELAHPDPMLDYPPFDFVYTQDAPAKDRETQLRNTKNYLSSLRKYLNREYMVSTDQRDELVLNIDNGQGGEYFNQLKREHTNENLTDLVTSKAEFPKIVAVGDQLVSRENPIYRDATSFRSHFFAPRKRIAGQSFDTLWYNIGVLWAMSTLLGLTLYFDVLRKVLALFRRWS